MQGEYNSQITVSFFGPLGNINRGAKLTLDRIKIWNFT